MTTVHGGSNGKSLWSLRAAPVQRLFRYGCLSRLSRSTADPTSSEARKTTAPALVVRVDFLSWRSRLPI
jgi:hypothetical protein